MYYVIIAWQKTILKPWNMGTFQGHSWLELGPMWWRNSSSREVCLKILWSILVNHVVVHQNFNCGVVQPVPMTKAQLEKKHSRHSSCHFLSDPRHSSMRPSVHFGSTVGCFSVPMRLFHVWLQFATCPKRQGNSFFSFSIQKKNIIKVAVQGRIKERKFGDSWYSLRILSDHMTSVPNSFLVTTVPWSRLVDLTPHCCSLSLAIFSSPWIASIHCPPMRCDGDYWDGDGWNRWFLQPSSLFKINMWYMCV